MTCWFFLFNRFSARIMDTIACTKFDRHSVVNLNETQCKFRKNQFLFNHNFIFLKMHFFYIVVCLCPYFFKIKTFKTSCRHDRVFIFRLFSISNPDTECRIVDIQCPLIVDQYRGRRFPIAGAC